MKIKGINVAALTLCSMFIIYRIADSECLKNYNYCYHQCRSSGINGKIYKQCQFFAQISIIGGDPNNYISIDQCVDQSVNFCCDDCKMDYDQCQKKNDDDNPFGCFVQAIKEASK